MRKNLKKIEIMKKREKKQDQERKNREIRWIEKNMLKKDKRRERVKLEKENEREERGLPAVY